MNRKLFAKADEESIDIVERAIGDLRKLGATIVDPGPAGALFQGCFNRYAPQLLQRRVRRAVPAICFPRQSDQIGDAAGNGRRSGRGSRRACRSGVSASCRAQGEGKYMINKYLRERGDANIKTNADLIAKARFYQDPNFPDRKQQRENAERQTVLDTSARLQTRFALQTILLQCMQEQRLDALVSPTATVPRRS